MRLFINLFLIIDFLIIIVFFIIYKFGDVLVGNNIVNNNTNFASDEIFDTKDAKKEYIDDYEKFVGSTIDEVEDDENVINNITNEIGSIYVEGTSISYPIMQANNNNYYLTHAPDGSYSKSGSIFMDYRNTIDDKKILIFGHNFPKGNNSPFHDLEKYKNYSFYKNHQYIDLTLDSKASKWQIFSVIIISNTTNQHMKIKFNKAQWDEHISWLINNSIYDTGITVGNDDRIVTLQTCYYKIPDTFLIVSAKNV